MSEPTPSGGPIRRSRWLLGALAVFVPVVPIVIALLLTGAGSSHTATAAQASAATSGSGSGTAASRSARAASPIPAGHGALVAYILRPQAIRSAPGGRSLGTLATKTSFGSQTTALVRRVRGRWLGVLSPVAGNNRLGWIRLSHVVLTRETWTLHVSLGEHELVVDHDGRTVRRYSVATGRPTAPTPTGTYAVTDRLTTGQPEGPYGCCILALSAKAPHAISDWDGGNRIAIHSYPITSTIGQSVSHGCIHVTDAEGEWLLHHIPLGAPVVISSA